MNEQMKLQIIKLMIMELKNNNIDCSYEEKKLNNLGSDSSKIDELIDRLKEKDLFYKLKSIYEIDIDSLSDDLFLVYVNNFIKIIQEFETKTNEEYFLEEANYYLAYKTILKEFKLFGSSKVLEEFCLSEVKRSYLNRIVYENAINSKDDGVLNIIKLKQMYYGLNADYLDEEIFKKIASLDNEKKENLPVVSNKEDTYIDDNINEEKCNYLSEFDRLITSNEENIDEEVISIYSVANFLSVVYKDLEESINMYKTRLENKFDTIFNILGFDYKKKELKLSVKYFDNFVNVSFYYKDHDLVGISDEKYIADFILDDAKDILVSFYKFYLDNRHYFNYDVVSLKTVNSDFYVNIEDNAVTLKSNLSAIFADFIIFGFINFEKVVFNIRTKEKELKKITEEQIALLFKNIYVLIDDLPSWCRDILEIIRINEIREIKSKEKEEVIVKEKEKVNGLKRFFRKWL